MNCVEYESLIALHVEGDLPTDEVAEVERHLAGCPHCAEFAGEMRASQEALKSFISVVPDPAIRRRVIATIEARRSRMQWLAVAAALFVLVAAGLAWSLRRPMEAPHIAQLPPEPPSEQTIAPAPKPAPLVTQRPPRRRPRPAPKFRTEPEQLARNTEPLFVKMLTDDPDVVIIWLIDGKDKENEEAPFGADGPRGE